MKTSSLLLLSLLLSLTAMASDTIPAGPFHLIDSAAMYAPALAPDADSIAAYLRTACHTDMERARAAYTWVATHISYDANAYNEGSIPDQSCSRILKRHVAVCQGYANVYKVLCNALGMEAVVIEGYAKAYSYREGQKFEGKKPGHAWNAVKVAGRWVLVDATWGSGFGQKVDGDLVNHKRLDTYWFDTDPYEFVFAHYPVDTQWLLVPGGLSIHQYEEMPRVRAAFFAFGFSGKELYESYLAGTLPETVPVAYNCARQLHLEGFPISGQIRAGTPLELKVTNDENITMIATQDLNGRPTPFVRNGNTYTLSLAPKHGDLYIGVSAKGNKYSTILSYKVK